MMGVGLRDARAAAADRRWFIDAYAEWIAEMGRDAAAAAAALAAPTAHAEAAARLAARDVEVLLIARDGAPAGFAVVERRGPSRRLAEFWIAHWLRGLGVGSAAVPLILDRHDTEWETAALAVDAAAVRFWRAAVTRYTGGRHTERLQDGEVRQRFLARGSARASSGPR
jgi:predicted acetyltransferase